MIALNNFSRHICSELTEHAVDKLEKILMMVHGVMDYIHCPVSSIEHDVSETGSVSILRWM
jgi:hypothetical protein